MEDSEMEEQAEVRVAMEALGELGESAPETVDANWVAADAQVGTDRARLLYYLRGCCTTCAPFIFTDRAWLLYYHRLET